jgi:hypothetical protein
MALAERLVDYGPSVSDSASSGPWRTYANLPRMSSVYTLGGIGVDRRRIQSSWTAPM